MAKGLTALAIKAKKAKPNRQEIPDEGCPGLYLVVQPSGSKSWAFRYRFGDTPRKLTIGPVLTVGNGIEEPVQAVLGHPNTVNGARMLAAKARHDVASGIDPGRQKKLERQDAKQRARRAQLLERDTVEAVCRAFIDKYARRKTREASWHETARLLGLKPDPADPSKLIETASKGEVISRWGDRSVHDIKRRDVNDLLDEIVSRGAPVAANRVLAALRKMFNWAASQDIVGASPCVGVARPAEETARDRILTDDELRLVWIGCDRIGWPFGPMIQGLILTLQRRDEVAEMRRDEIDGKTWTIPAARVKNGTAHEVPLSAAAAELFGSQRKIGKDKGGLIFTTDGIAPVSGFSRAKDRLDAAIVDIQHGEATARGERKSDVKPIPHWTLHDLRRTGASGMARLGIQLPVIEKVLNHTSGSFRGVVGVYQRHSYADEKRKALDAWADAIKLILSRSAGARK
jgi:integrase